MKRTAMKRTLWAFALLMLAVPAWAEKKITVHDLTDMLASLHQYGKSDEEMSSEMKKCELSEELTRQAMESLAPYLAGPLSTSQLYVLEARSAMLAPPAADMPSLPAPDAAGQKDLIDKAQSYGAGNFAQLPALTATKTLSRFADDTTTVIGMAGTSLGTAGPDAYVHTSTDSLLHYVRYIGQTAAPVTMDKGVEKRTAKRDKTRWGENGKVMPLTTGPALNTVLQEARTAGKIAWLRWETVNGWQTAVFSFAVDKKTSHYAIDYCCFPDVGQVGQAGRSGVTQYGDTGNLQNTVDWIDFKTALPYHGEFFIDAKTGIVVRLVTQGDFKSTDLVSKEDQRIDYSPVKVGDKEMVLPVRTIIDTEVIPSGESGAVRHSTRRTLFTIEYKDYKLGG